MLHTLATGFVVAVVGGQPAERIVVTEDDTRIDRSCVVVIPEGTIIEDDEDDGAIHVVADDVTIEFAAGSVLQGAASLDPWDRLSGTGVRINGRSGVTLRNATVRGYKVGVLATNADGLSVETADLSDNYRQRLKSTPEQEDASDWLYPHQNDQHQWRLHHGAALCIERSSNVAVTGVHVRRGQNGIVLDRVSNSRIYDNDCSFLSGWGLAMWRSCDNIISRNAFDFCVRGHVEGVYNRGQDSAGILMFEQNCRNVIAENSATHGGDGLFAFAGNEALGQGDLPEGYSARRLGNNDNIIVGNDFSYAPAHGLELTFSFGNYIAGNRLVENAICGIWGGFSQQNVIVENEIARNGGMAYGLERGGINIEHGRLNLIAMNRFENNRCGIHLWRDDPGPIATFPWGEANYEVVTDRRIAMIVRNEFIMDTKHPFDADAGLIGLQVRDTIPEAGSFGAVVYAENDVTISSDSAVETDLAEQMSLVTTSPGPWRRLFVLPQIPDLPGTSSPVGARTDLRGRDKIIMGPWGPWDHESIMVRKAKSGGDRDVYEAFGMSLPPVQMDAASDAIRPSISMLNDRAIITWKLPDHQSFARYQQLLDWGTGQSLMEGTLLRTTWTGHVFPWTADTDPREEFEAWRSLADANGAHEFTRSSLDFAYAMGGPATIRPQLADGIGNDRFGMIASTVLELPAGTWRIWTESDDGVRVLVDGTPVIDNWTWHAPTTDVGEFTLDEAREVRIEVMHFEIDGYALLRFEIEPVD